MSDDEALARQRRETIEKLGAIAARAGVVGKIDNDGERFVAGFGFEDGRSQMVYARPLLTPEGAAVCVYSPAAKYKKSMFGGGLNKALALDLLIRNESLFFARYGVRDYEDELLVVASVDLLIDSLDVDELRSAMNSVSTAADVWEDKAGKGDSF